MAYQLANEIVGSVVEGISRELRAGHKVTLEGLGSFWPRLVEPHTKMSHITKREHQIPKTRKVSFRLSEKLRRL
jgi:nucleoid DNA-binding protein